MIENPYFKGLDWLMLAALVCTIPMPRAILELLYIPWNELMNIKGINYYSRAQTNVGLILLSFFFLVPVIYKSLINCQCHIKNGHVSKKQGWKEYFQYFMTYFCILFMMSGAVLLIGPPIIEIRRYFVPNDAMPR